MATFYLSATEETLLISPILIDSHRRILRRYLWTQRESILQVPELVARGANNALYRIFLNEQPVLAKIGLNPFYRRLHIEYAVLRQLAPVCPEPIEFFNDDRSGLQVLLLQQLDGVHPFALEDTDVMAAGRAISLYHRCTSLIDNVPTEQGGSFIENGVLQVQQTGGLQPYRESFQKMYDELLEYSNHPGRNPPFGRNVLVHGDLVPRNIMRKSDGTIRIIDWEGARYDAPEADLATFVKAYRLTGTRREQFFSAYALPVDRKRLNYRLAKHYLQVIAWRLAIQLSWEQGKRYEEAMEELREELATAEELVGRLS